MKEEKKSKNKSEEKKTVEEDSLEMLIERRKASANAYRKILNSLESRKNKKNE